MEKGEQGGGRAIHARYGNRMQAMTEKELRRLMDKNSGKYVVYDAKDHDVRMNQTIEESYHCPHHRQDDGRRKEEGSEEAKLRRNYKLFVTHYKTCS